MINAITLQLLVVLLGASLLGILIGSSAMQLLMNRRLKTAYSANAGVGEGQYSNNLQAGAFNDQDAGLSLEGFSPEGLPLGGLSQDEQTQLAAQQETLQAHANLQEQRVEKLTSELHASEERRIRLQRDFASFKANKLREVRMLKVGADEWLDDEELPVLNKKVEQVTAHSADVEQLEMDEEQSELDQSQPIISSELDIPSLAEFELPDSVEELEFVLDKDDEPT